MIKAKTTILFQKPVDEVFKFVATDYVRNHPRWDARSVKTELQGPMATGARGVETRREGPATRAYDFEVVDFQSNKHMRFKARCGSTRFAAVYLFEPTTNGSQLTMDFDLSFGGFMRLFEPLMGGGVKKEMAKSGAKIKDLLEGK